MSTPTPVIEAHLGDLNGLKTGTFYEGFSEYVEKLSCASGKVIILGEFNIKFFDTSGFAYKRFVDILETFVFVQHIDKPTHNSGHLLDYIITRKDITGVSNVYVSDFICDHRALHISLTCNRVHPERKQIDVRSLSIWPAVQSLRRGLSTNPGATMWCVCGCS